MPLLKNVNHELFCRYIVEGNSAAESVKKAGFMPNADQGVLVKTAAKLNSRKDIAERIKELREKGAARTTVTAARIMEEFAKIGFANMMDYVKIQSDGSAYVDMKDLTREQAAAISEIVVDTYMDGKGDEAREVKRIRVKLHDKQAALVNMGKHLGMFTNRVEVTGKNGGPIELSNKVEVALLSRDEREMLKSLLLLASERKRGQAVGIPAPSIDADYEEQQ
jgi:phage terminase small subunit